MRSSPVLQFFFMKMTGDPRDLLSLQTRRSPVLPARLYTLEVQLAVAEATCARRTALATVAAALDQYYGGQVRNRYRSEIETRSEEHTSELQSRQYLACRLLLEKQTIHYLASP